MRQTGQPAWSWRWWTGACQGRPWRGGPTTPDPQRLRGGESGSGTSAAERARLRGEPVERGAGATRRGSASEWSGRPPNALRHGDARCRGRRSRRTRRRWRARQGRRSLLPARWVASQPGRASRYHRTAPYHDLHSSTEHGTRTQPGERVGVASGSAEIRRGVVPYEHVGQGGSGHTPLDEGPGRSRRHIARPARQTSARTLNDPERDPRAVGAAAPRPSRRGGRPDGRPLQQRVAMVEVVERHLDGGDGDTLVRPSRPRRREDRCAETLSRYTNAGGASMPSGRTSTTSRLVAEGCRVPGARQASWGFVRVATAARRISEDCLHRRYRVATATAAGRGTRSPPAARRHRRPTAVRARGAATAAPEVPKAMRT